jgi:MoxR-like ATPase
VSLVHATRNHPALLLGASPRGSLALVRTAQASALIDGRDYVMPDDVKRMAHWVLPHRFIARERSRTRFGNCVGVIDDVLGEVPVPIGTAVCRGEGS